MTLEEVRTPGDALLYLFEHAESIHVRETVNDVTGHYSLADLLAISPSRAAPVLARLLNRWVLEGQPPIRILPGETS